MTQDEKADEYLDMDRVLGDLTNSEVVALAFHTGALDCPVIENNLYELLAGMNQDELNEWITYAKEQAKNPKTMLLTRLLEW